MFLVGFFFVHLKQMMYKTSLNVSKSYCVWYYEALAACWAGKLLLTRLTHSLSSPSSGIESHSCRLLFHGRLCARLVNDAFWWCVFLGQCEPFPQGLCKTGPECVAAVSSRGPAGLVHTSHIQVELVSHKHVAAAWKKRMLLTFMAAPIQMDAHEFIKLMS